VVGAGELDGTLVVGAGELEGTPVVGAGELDGTLVVGAGELEGVPFGTHEGTVVTAVVEAGAREDDGHS
jgi:hypothetical protein